MMMVPGVMKMIIGVVYNQTKIKKNVKKKKKKKKKNKKKKKKKFF